MTNTTQHTPGPWTASQFAQWTISSDDGHIAKVYGADGHHQNPEQAQANARLIAAAPTMLAEIEKQIRWLKHVKPQTTAPDIIMIGFDQSIKYLELVSQQARGQK